MCVCVCVCVCVCMLVIDLFKNEPLRNKDSLRSSSRDDLVRAIRGRTTIVWDIVRNIRVRWPKHSFSYVCKRMRMFREQHQLEKRWFRREWEADGLCKMIDILLLQEHHLGRERTKLFKDPLPGDWYTWWAPAHGVLERRGGVCMSVRKSADITILDHGILIEGRAMFCYLEWRNVKFGMLNVYAPNSSNERTSFWRLLANKIPSFDNWIVAGDLT